MVKRGDMMSIDDVTEILAIEILGVVPDDESIVVAANKGEPAVTDPESFAGQAYRNIVKRIQANIQTKINANYKIKNIICP